MPVASNFQQLADFVLRCPGGPVHTTQVVQLAIRSSLTIGVQLRDPWDPLAVHNFLIPPFISPTSHFPSAEFRSAASCIQWKLRATWRVFGCQ